MLFKDEHTFHEMIQNAPAHVVTMLGALREFVGTNQMMAYLTMMDAQLVELHRALIPIIGASLETSIG